MIIRAIFLSLVAVNFANAITANELQELLNSSTKEHSDQETNIKNNQMHKILPVSYKNPQLPPNANQPLPAPGNPNNPVSPAKTAAPSLVGGPKEVGVLLPPRDTNRTGYQPVPPRYLPPNAGHQVTPNSIPEVENCHNIPPSWCKKNRNNSRVKSKGSDAEVATIHFGIKRGSTFKGEILRVISNADYGNIEVIVKNTLHGDIRELESGTILFCDKRFNQGTRRLDVECTSGITPSGFEFDNVSLLVRGNNMQAGLTGTVKADSKISQRAASKGLGTAISSAASKVAGGNLLAESLAASAESLASQSNRVLDDKAGRLNNVIVVNPTDLYLYAGRTF